MKKSNKGFTLVELIVVIAIIGILAAILVPAMIGYITDSKLSSANSSAKQVFTAINNYCEKVVANSAPIPNGDLADQAIVGKGSSNTFGADAETATVPDTPPTTLSAWGPYLNSAVGLSMGDEANGTIYSVTIKSGFPTALIWKKSSSDPYVGGYPKQADEKNWTLAKAGGSSTPAGGGSGGTDGEADS